MVARKVPVDTSEVVENEVRLAVVKVEAVFVAVLLVVPRIVQFDMVAEDAAAGALLSPPADVGTPDAVNVGYT